MNILLWIILGGAAGWIASMVMGTNESQGILMDVLLGVIGAVVGGLMLGLFGIEGATGFNLWSLLVAILGAVVLIALGRALRAPTTA